MRTRIDPLIAERARWLHASHALGRASRHCAERILAYQETLRVAEEIKDDTPSRIMAKMASKLVRHIDVQGLHNIPSTGPALVVANHPTGIADGLFLYHAMHQLRPDLFFYANSDILRVFPQMSEFIVPVEWRSEKRSLTKTKKALQMTASAFEEGRLGVIFPSGRLAKRRGLRVFEREWLPSAAVIARKLDVPIVPVHIQARNSALFYLFDAVHPSLRDITLFYETLNKSRQPFHIRIGRSIAAKALPVRSADAIATLRQKTLSLGDKDARGMSLVRTSPLLHGLV